MSAPDWSPFKLAQSGSKGDAPRSIDTPEGIGDRLRTAAFAEIQAREAFIWASGRFEEAPEELRRIWKSLALAEDRHLRWLLSRMQELGVALDERRVSDQLWISLRSCQTAREFALYMASAEQRGRIAGEKFHQAMIKRDEITAEIFRKIAEEEVEHIAVASRYFGYDGSTTVPHPNSGHKPSAS